MKRISICLLAGGMLTFTACQQESSTGMSQLQIDSAVNARVDSIRTDMMMRNDSMINAMAMQKADSILMARGSNEAGATVGKTPKPSTGTTKPTTTPPTTTKPTTPSNTTRPGSDQGGVKANNTTRPGSNEGSQSKEQAPSNTNRPGANR